MKTTIILFILCFGSQLLAQDPAIEWQNTVGGADMDMSLAVDITTDGGSIIAGTSQSNISGDKTENSNGALDLWIVKLDDAGSLEWQNTIGGSGDDYATSIKQTSDGGYIVGAGSDSNISGDKTENSRGGLDYWILKLDAAGTIVWQRTYGGAQPDFEVRIIESSDGGYFVSGYSDSDISGDKTDPGNGQRDFWALKLDSNGNLQWQNSIGGNLIDRPLATFQTADNGYIMAGGSTSDASGDKTENSQGSSDYWVVKLDSSGSVVWDNTIGGSGGELIRDAIETADGNLLIGGYSTSNISGDKTENSLGSEDYWVLKLDPSGSIIWQNTIGGNAIDYLTNLEQLPTGEYLVSGYSQSNISGDKTDDSNGGYDVWVLKLDSNGALLSQNTLGGAGDESRAFMRQIGNGDYIIACTSDSNISGDKTENSEGAEDYWIFRSTSLLLDVAENIDLSSITAYPNPTTGTLQLLLPKLSNSATVSVFDSRGVKIASEEYFDLKQIPLSITGAAGLYYLEITSGNLSETIKIIKQ